MLVHVFKRFRTVRARALETSNRFPDQILSSVHACPASPAPSIPCSCVLFCPALGGILVRFGGVRVVLSGCVR
jgi:hypothetical protein